VHYIVYVKAVMDRIDNMTDPTVTFLLGSIAFCISWFSTKLKIATVVLPAWMEWSGAVFSWLGMVCGGLTAAISLFLVIRGKLLAKTQRRRKTDR
jgi:hypothetical protein